MVDLGELVLIDNGCGPGWRGIRDNIREAGYHPKAIHTMVLTHCHVDHIGGRSASLPAANKKHMSIVPRLFAKHQFCGVKSQVIQGVVRSLNGRCMWVAI